MKRNPGKSRFADMTVLWADDDPALPRYAVRLLEGVVGRVVTAADGKEAVERFLDEAPDLVLLDVEMPGMDGIEAAEAIRGENPEVPIVMVTGRDDRETMRKSIRCRIDDYLVKPADPEELLRVLERCALRMEKLPREHLLPDGSLYDPGAKALLRDRQVVPLTRNEARLLELLIRHRGKVVPLEEISWELWAGEPVSESAFKSVIARLRAKVGKEAVANHPGVGYSLR